MNKPNKKDDSELPLLPSGSLGSDVPKGRGVPSQGIPAPANLSHECGPSPTQRPEPMPKTPLARPDQNSTLSPIQTPTQARGPMSLPKPTQPQKEGTPKIPSKSPETAELASAKSQTHPSRKIPKSIGAYEILEEINRGGMGIVYKAFDSNLRRHVAIKVLLAGEGATEEDVKRFQREAQATARLQHSNIVPIYAVGNHEGKPYFVMDFIEGKTAKQLKETGLIAPRLALSIIEGVADALHHAHLNGVIHRDVKPGNILVDKFQRAQLMDFGLARRVDEDLSITQAGTTMGTPSYMAPEQAEGKLDEVDAQSDLYSAGACLYELLTGQPPFDGSTIMSILRKVVDDAPIPPRQLNSKIHRDVEIICLKCLEKDKSQRYANCKELAEDIRRFSIGEAISAKPLGVIPTLWRRARRHKEIAIASVVVLGVTLAALGYAVIHSRQVATEQKRVLHEKLDIALVSARKGLNEATESVELLGAAPRNTFESESARVQELIDNAVVAFRQVEGLAADNLEVKKSLHTLNTLQTTLEVNGFVFRARMFLNPVAEGLDGKIDQPNYSGAEFAAREALKRQRDHEEARRLLNIAMGIRAVYVECSGPTLDVYARRILDRTRRPIVKLGSSEIEDKGDLLGATPVVAKTIEPGLYIISFVGKNTAMQQMTLWVSRETLEEDLHLKLTINGGGEQNMASIPEGSVNMPQLGPQKVSAFLIDRYEFPNRPGVYPETGFSALEIKEKATKKCESVGKKVCNPAQWLRACMGESDRRYPYGKTYLPNVCATGYVMESQKEPFISGFFAKCHTPEGVYDMSGNVAEWTDTDQTEKLFGGEYTSLTGVPDLTVSCRSRLLTAEGNPARVGFRCCKTK